MGVSWLDLAIAVYLLLHLVTGFQQGLFLGGMSLAVALSSLGLGLALTPPLAYFTGLSPLAISLTVTAIFFALLKLAQGELVKRFGPRLSAHPRLQRVDRWLGLLPGLAWGALGAGLVAWFVAAFSGGLPNGSPLAGTLLGVVRLPLMTLGQAIPEADDKP